MPDDLDPNLSLRISGDATGATKAAGQAEEALRGVAGVAGEATGATEQMGNAEEEAAAKAERLNALMKETQQALMRNAFYMHRLAEGFKDLSQGGRMTGQGMMDIAESLQYMLGPQSAMYVALLQIPLMLGSLAMAHRKGADAAKAHEDGERQAAEAIKAASDTYAQTVKTIEDAGVGTYDNIASAAARAAAAIDENIRATKELQRAQDELNDAELASRLAKIDLQEAQAESGMTPEQKKESERQFSLIRLKARQDRAQEKADAAANEKAQDIADTQAEIAAALDAQAKKDAALKEQKNQLELAGAGIADVPSDADLAESQLAALRKKQVSGELNGPEQAQLEKLERDAPDLRFKQAATGPTYKSTLDAPAIQGVEDSGGLQARLKEQLENEQKFLAQASDNPVAGKAAVDARAAADAIQAQIDALAKYQGAAAAVAKEEAENAKAKEATNTKVIADQDKITAQQVELKAKKIEASTVTTLTEADFAKLTNQNREDEEEEAAKKLMDDLKAKRESDLSDIDAQIKAATNEATKTALEKRKAAIEAQGIEDEANINFNTGKIDQIQLDAERTKAKNTRGNADTVTQKQSDREELESLEGRIEGGDDKNLKTALRDFLEVNRGKDTETLIAGIQQLMAAQMRNVDATVSLGETVNRHFSEVNRKLDQHEAMINRNSHSSR